MAENVQTRPVPEGPERELRDFGPFEIIEKIGAGAAGIVYKARHKSMDKIVALKILSRKLSENPKFIKRFVAEARAAGKLSHPNIVRGIDVGEAGGKYYFSMEIVEGRNLDQVLKDEGRFEEKRALRIALDIASALGHACANGIIHRDVKPSNIMIDPENRALLTDMGLARRDDAESWEKEGAVLGTPDYMSPEQIEGASDLDTRTDIYSLGITLFQMLTGAPPFTGGSPKDVMAKHLRDDLPHPLDSGVEVSQAAWDLLARMTAKDKRDRFGAPDELADAIRAALAGPFVPAARPSQRMSSRRPRRRRAAGMDYLYVLVAAAVLLIGAVIVFSSIGGEDGDGEGGDLTPGPKPKPVPGPRKDEEPRRPGDDEAMEREMRKALDAYALNPDLLDATIKRLKEIAADAPPESSAIIWKEIERIRGEATGIFKSLLSSFDKAAGNLIKSGEYGKAWALAVDFRGKFSARYGCLEAFSTTDAVEKKIVSAAEAEAETLKSRIDALVTNDKFDEAMELADRIGRMGVGKTGSEASALRKAISQAKAEWEDEMRRAAEMEALNAARSKAQPLVKSRDFAGAVRVFEEARSRIKEKAIWEEVTREIRDVDDLAAFLKAAGGAGNKAAGRVVEIQGNKGEITRIEGGKVFVKSGNVQVGIRIEDMTPAELSGIVEAGLDMSSDKALRRGYAVYHIRFGDRRKAAEILAMLGLGDEEKAYYAAKTGD